MRQNTTYQDMVIWILKLLLSGGITDDGDANVLGQQASTTNDPQRRRFPSELVVLGVLLFIAVAAFTEAPGAVGELIRRQVLNSFALLTSIQLIAGMIAIFTLERFFPAQPNVPLFSPPVAMDAIYTFVVQPLTVVVLTLMATPLSSFLSENLSFLVVDTTRDLPWPVALVAGLVITDFFVWLAHVLKHKIPLLWRFHIIHHAQHQMNMFSSSRIHPLEHIQDLLIQVLPYFILFPSLTENWKAFFLLSILYAWQQRFQHSNIRTNLGPLRYLIVTPQSHRVHHSLVPNTGTPTTEVSSPGIACLACNTMMLSRTRLPVSTTRTFRNRPVGLYESSPVACTSKRCIRSVVM